MVFLYKYDVVFGFLNSLKEVKISCACLYSLNILID